MQQVLAKLANPGFAMIVLGAVLTYGAKMFVGLLHKEKETEEKLTLICKGAGLVLAIIGAVVLFLK